MGAQFRHIGNVLLGLFRTSEIRPKNSPIDLASCQYQKSCPSLRTLFAIESAQTRFRRNLAFLPSNDPATDTQGFTDCYVMPEAHSQFAGKRLAISREHCFGHRLIKHGADNASMDDSTEPLAHACRGPRCVDRAVNTKFIAELQPSRIVRTAYKTGGLWLSLKHVAL
jgi:hypothetical protein